MNFFKYILTVSILIFSLLEVFAQNDSDPVKRIYEKMRVDSLLKELTKYTDNQEYDVALSLCDSLIMDVERVYGAISIPAFNVLCTKAGIFGMREDFNRSLESLIACRNILQELDYSNTLEYAIIIRSIARTTFALGNTTEAIDTGKEALKIIGLIFGEKHTEYAETLDNIAQFYSTIDYNEAIKFAEEGLKIRNEVLNPDHPDCATSLLHLANYNCGLRLFPKAINFAKEALNINVKVFGESHTETLFTINTLARIYFEAGEYLEALKFYEKALELNKVINGVNNNDYATSLSNMSKCYMEVCNYQEAIKLGAEALSIRREVFGERHPDYAKFLNTLARCYENIGEYQEAIKLMSEALAIDKDILGENNPDYATTLNNLANANFHLGNYHEAVSLGTKTLEIFDEIYGEKHPNYATALSNLASYSSALGNYEEAVKFGKKAMEIREELLGEKHPDYALSLCNLAEYNSELGNYQEAVNLATQALDIRKEILGEKHPDYATALNNLSSYYSFLANYEEAVRLGTMAIEIYNEKLGERDLKYALCLSNLAEYNSELGNYQDALNLATQALDIRKEILGEKHPDYATSLNNLANVTFLLGNYQEAISLGTKAMEIRKEVLGEKHPDYVISLNNLAGYNSELGNYQEALSLGIKAMEIRKEVLGEKHPYFVQSVNNVALYNSKLGNYQEAVRLGNMAMDICKESLGEKHPYYATILSNLAGYNFDLGDCQEAIRLGTSSLEIRKGVLGEKHPDYTTSLNNLALYNIELDNFQEAIRLGTMAKEIFEEVLGKHHPEYATILTNLADCQFFSGNFQEAIRLGSMGMEIYKELLGDRYPNYLMGGRSLTLYFFFTHEKDKLRSTMLSLLPSFERNIKLNFSYLPVEQRKQYWNKNREPFELIHTYISFYPDEDFIQAGYNSVLFSKGILLNSEQEFSQFLSKTGSEDLMEKYNEIRNIRLQLNKLYEKPIAERYVDTDSLERHATDLERQLMEESQEFGDYTKGLSVTMDDVRKNLGKRDAAIEFVSFNNLNDSTMYMAYVLKKDLEAPVLVKLFEERELSEHQSDTDEEGNSTSLYENKVGSKLIWGKLAPHLDGIENIYFAPDGILHQMAIEYFPDFENDGLISERYHLHRLSSTRELALNKKDGKRGSSEAVLYGGINYDTDVRTLEEESARQALSSTRSFTPYTTLSDSLTVRGGVKYLKYTLKESETINGLMADSHYQPVLFSGEEATEESFKSQGGKHKSIMHISTHGFYWEKDEAEAEAKKNTRLMFMSDFGNNNRRNVEDKALTRTGLLMAGANNVLSGKQIPENVDDGILTAKEIADIDLRDLDLVVLSACQTGMGDISGDGVFGLQRGFKKAGANSILMSLWDVDDEATHILMTSFYKNYLGGKSKQESLLEAQKEVRNTPGFANPEYWAAFILLDGLN